MTCKTCRLCTEVKELSEFYSGDTRCKVCVLRLKKHQRDTWTQVEKEEAAKTRKAFAATPNGYYSMYTSNAKTRGLDFSLTKEEFLSFWQTDCGYCGEKLKGIGLDRIDNVFGYTKDNVVPCCTQCNMMKKDLTYNQFIGKINSIHKHLKLGEQI